MKKLAAFLCLALSGIILSGCSGVTVVYSDCTDETVSTTVGGLKTGLAVVTEASGEEFDVTLAAVLVDENGVIMDCVIDGIHTPASADGQLLSKQELGFDYGMVASGTSDKEWFQQADALAEYAVGKTPEELAAGYGSDADLATSATIFLGGYVSAIQEAARNAEYLGAQAGDTLKLAAVSEISGGELACDVTALSMNGETITSCYIDSLQATMDGSNRTKNQLGYDYGMVAWGGAGYEWFEQARNFASYVTGKTAAEVAGIAVTEDGKAGEVDLAASVTIAIAGLQDLVGKAAR